MENKPKGYGAWTPERVAQACDGSTMQQRPDGDWEPAKPLPYFSWPERIRQAWDVLTYKADALYWYFQKGTPRNKAVPEEKKEITLPSGKKVGVEYTEIYDTLGNPIVGVVAIQSFKGGFVVATKTALYTNVPEFFERSTVTVGIVDEGFEAGVMKERRRWTENIAPAIEANSAREERERVVEKINLLKERSNTEEIKKALEEVLIYI